MGGWDGGWDLGVGAWKVEGGIRGFELRLHVRGEMGFEAGTEVSWVMQGKVRV